LAHMRKYLVCKLPDIFKEGEVRFIELIMLTFFFLTHNFRKPVLLN